MLLKRQIFIRRVIKRNACCAVLQYNNVVFWDKPLPCPTFTVHWSAFFFWLLSGKLSIESIKTRPTGSKTTKALLYACVADHSDGRVSSVQLGNASAPVKPASCLINSSYCLSILYALLTSTRTTLFPHLRSLLTSSFRIYPFTVHQSGLQGPYRRGLSKWLRVFFS